VAIYLRKSIDAVASVFGILKAGATYVPVDPESPVARAAYIMGDCAVRAVICDRALEPALRTELAGLGHDVLAFALDPDVGSVPLAALLDALQREDAAPATPTAHPSPDDLAYILYTSGSTGKPKGVMLTHRSARSFVEWCTVTFRPTAEDVFSSHAPLHFDLSILDIFVSIGSGAALVLIGEKLGKDPLSLAPVIAEKRISVWYSTPSILSLLAHHGRLERFDYGALRLVLFAGEVFPVPQLRSIKALWPHPRYFNLYGPTETNVCTYAGIPAEIPADRVDPYPIGHTCEHLEARVVDVSDRDVARGEEGELLIAGPGVMAGYWNLPDRNARAFLVDAKGRAWYRTGDLVVEHPTDGFIFHGRRDRMVKRLGYRVELGEIEAALAAHPDVREVAVVARSDPEAGVRITAYLTMRQGKRASIIALKQFCVGALPRYMVPDFFDFLDGLPRTSTDKIDYETLRATA
jgi:amino acid adenylation domain-containing protein